MHQTDQVSVTKIFRKDVHFSQQEVVPVKTFALNYQSSIIEAIEEALKEVVYDTELLSLYDDHKEVTQAARAVADFLYDGQLKYEF